MKALVGFAVLLWIKRLLPSRHPKGQLPLMKLTLYTVEVPYRAIPITQIQGLLIMGSKLVDVYWNLHKCKYSLRDVYTGKVFDHRRSLVLKDAQFQVQKGGRQRVLREGKKNVHAFVRGEYYSSTPLQMVLDADQHYYREVTYDPYIHETFVFLRTEGEDDQEPIDTLPWVIMETKPINAIKSKAHVLGASSWPS